MKSGRSLTDLAIELDRQLKSKRDFIADTSVLTMTEDAKGFKGIEKDRALEINEHSHNQIGQRLEIPAKYYDKMRTSAPALLADNVNHWFHKQPEKRLVRTLDNRVRAFLSNKYRPIDNYDVASAVLPKIQKMGCQVQSCEITETKMYLKVVTEKMTAEVTKGDIVQAGIAISNSEIGCGSVRVEPLIYRLACLNGMIVPESGIRKYHVGKMAETLDNAVEYFRPETIKADNKAFMMKIQDIVSGVLDGELFQAIVNNMRKATKDFIESKPVAAIEEVQRIFTLSDDETDNVLTQLIKEGDMSRYGLLNAMTAASKTIEDYDRATEFERFGGKVMELSGVEWKEIAQAA